MIQSVLQEIMRTTPLFFGIRIKHAFSIHNICVQVCASAAHLNE